jgi:large subunit ribosomal protein L29
MNLREIRGKTTSELEADIRNLREELFKLRLRKVTDVIENPSFVRGLRKDIARIRTILREREMGLARSKEPV